MPVVRPCVPAIMKWCVSRSSVGTIRSCSDRSSGRVLDIYSKSKRSAIMSAVRSTNTKPEIKVRSLLHSMGFRFRLHRNDLPGCPDIVLPRHRTIVFVHGCFWHQHSRCDKNRYPKQNRLFWERKLKRNVERDREVCVQLQKEGWKVITVWECEVSRSPSRVVARLGEELGKQ